MANRRMFSLDVVDTDTFLDLPISSQALYFHLGMRADDDGFVSAPKKVITIIGAKQDDLKLLIVKRFVIACENGIVVIRHWKQNNYIQADRYKKTVYQDQLATLTVNNGIYEVDTQCIQTVSKVYPQVRLGKDSIDKDSIDKNSIDIISSELEAPETALSGILLPLVDKTDYNIPLSKIEKWKEAYPAVDVDQELHKMAVWLDSNPQRKKTRRGIDRFINTWLSREQDKGGIYRNANRQQDQGAQTSGTYELSEEYKNMYSQLKGGPSSPDAPF